MPKSYSFAFSINGVLDPSFSKTMSNAQAGLVRLKDNAKQVQKEIDQLGKSHKQGLINDSDFGAKMQPLLNQKEAYNAQASNLAGLINTHRQAQAAFTESRNSLIRWGLGVTAAAQPLIGMIKTAASFEKTMSKVGAITKAGSDDMALLTNKARELGEKTQYSATQVAESMTYLGMAGWKAQQITAGLPGLLNLAAAGGTNLAVTADIVSDNLTAFGLAAEKAGHMADVYATIITSTNTDVNMLGETMKYAAPVAKAFGASMEETAALAGLMANAGIKASQAGTALRAGFLRLAGPPKAAAKELDKLGISASDMTKEQAEATAALKAMGVETGNLQGPEKMEAILRQLRARFKEMSDEEQVASGKAIFGANAVTGWLAVLSSGEGEFETLVKNLHNCDGAAEEMAKKMQNNAAGAATRLQSAMESVAISVGGTFLPAIADGADSLAKMAGSMSKVASEHPALVSGFVSLAGSVAGLVLVYKTATLIQTAYIAAKSSYMLLMGNEAAMSMAAAAANGALATSQGAATAATWGFNAALAANPIGLVVAGVAALVGAGYLLYKNWDTVTKFMSDSWNAVKNGVVYGIGYIVGYLASLPERILYTFTNLDTVGATFIEKAKSWGKGALEGIIDYFTNLPGRLTEFASRAWEEAKSVFSKGYSAGSGTGKPVAHNANGGIYNKGAFLTTFAENSGESAIPHSPTARNVSLLAKTNEIMGRPLGGNAVSINYNPQITINGEGNSQSLTDALAEERRKLEAMLRDFANQQRRTSYA